MTDRRFTLDELIDGEIETIMYTCAPQTVKDVARRRLKELRAERDAARGKAPDATLPAYPHCKRCGGFGYLIYSEDESDWMMCDCFPNDCSEAGRKGEAA